MPSWRRPGWRRWKDRWPSIRCRWPGANIPGAPASLDALCRRFSIDNSARSLHGALLDAELLAEVYLELIGGRQAGFDLVQAEVMAAAAVAAAAGPARPPRPHTATLEELAAHAAMLDDETAALADVRRTRGRPIRPSPPPLRGRELHILSPTRSRMCSTPALAAAKTRASVLSAAALAKKHGLS